MTIAPIALRAFVKTALLLLALALHASMGAAADTPHTPPRYELNVHLDPRARTLAVTGTLILENPTSNIDLRLDDALTITAFSINGQAHTPDRSGAHWRVTPAANGEETPQTTSPLRLTFSYEGTLPALPTHGHGHIALMVGTWGAMLEESGNWYPRLASGEPAHFRTHLHTPPPYRAVTTGRPTHELETSTGLQATFDTIAPVMGLSLFAGNWTPKDKTVATGNGPVLIRAWFRDHQADMNETYLDAAGRHIQTYSETIGPYPYGAFHIVAAPFPVGLGYPGLTYIAERVLPFRFVPETSLRHEVLHSWWGNGIEIDYKNGNWAEGLTTYMADYARARERRPTAARDMRLDWLRDFAALPASEDRPPVHFTNKTHDASQVIGYNKVAFFLHMLERKIGADAFARAMRTFWQKHIHRVAGWSDLRATFEKTSGQQLGPFFAQWLERAGAPMLHLDSPNFSKTADGFEVTFTLTQSQDAAPYVLDVPVVLETDDAPQTATVTMTQTTQTFHLRSKARPRRLAIDPEFDLFRRFAPGESPPIFRDVTLHPETRTIVATTDRDGAHKLAHALLDHPPMTIERLADAPAAAPVLVIGDAASVSAYLPRPAPLQANEGKDRVGAWVGRDDSGRVIMVVAVSSADALAEAARRLPHYGRKSYVRLLTGRRGTSGILPGSGGVLSHTFTD